MKGDTLTPLERFLAVVSHKEPDRVPLFLFPTLHGARELDMTLTDYFTRGENIVEGQLKLREKYQHDCLTGFFYAAAEVEAWGGEVLRRDDGPFNSGRPIIRDPEQILDLSPPIVDNARCLQESIKATAGLAAECGKDVPILGVAISPFSLPVMQMGFGSYLELMHDRPALFEALMAINEEFCVDWANAQLEAGATAIVYFDPVSSTTIIPRDLYLTTGLEVARRTIPRIQGPTGTHFASGHCLSIIPDIISTGTGVIGVSAEEDLSDIKTACDGKLTIVGNLNGVEMRRWTEQDAEHAVKTAIAKAGRGGGFILADNHGEIPWHVSEETLLAISSAVDQWGRYPLDWIDADA
ncbi:MAG: methylcobamide--CoM methyltransferase MtbA [Verrucomicrobia bacterium]|jgi:uroporphyrinogen decarboxylase|nr:methylcobamide--CoM methyltransferase MtbA [Verrucomicrobiota bacterium]MBT7067681.1 methylcobamide--CoM methyltransferase MtbA [Verrucomicrobiota bacterium]MBT7699782.1 methylcobamide--CoM methyltransferase MtbA [Verrucomicrobiota bacterium]